MQSDDPRNSPASPTGAVPAHVLVEQRLVERLRNTISPLGVEIDFAALKNWAQHKQQDRFRHQNLIKELRLWAPLLVRRPVNRIMLDDPFCLLDSPSLTELIYALGQNLRLMQGHHAEHAIALHVNAINRQNVALLRGLEFNHIQIKLPFDCDIADSKKLMDLLGEFKFTFISIELTLPQDAAASAMHIMEILSFLKPATVTLRCTKGEINPTQFAPMLMQFGYYFQHPNVILKFQSPLHSRPDDCIRLGPNGRSNLGGLQLRTTECSREYNTHLSRGILPIQLHSP